MKINAQFLAIGMMYVAFYAMIAISVYYTKSAFCLFALLFTPQATWGDDKNNDND